jgi:hypothetical protein
MCPQADLYYINTMLNGFATKILVSQQSRATENCPRVIHNEIPEVPFLHEPASAIKKSSRGTPGFGLSLSEFIESL